MDCVFVLQSPSTGGSSVSRHTTGTSRGKGRLEDREQASRVFDRKGEEGSRLQTQSGPERRNAESEIVAGRRRRFGRSAEVAEQTQSHDEYMQN